MSKPVPQPTTDTREFWAGCNREQLLYQKCRHCRHVQFYPRQNCIACDSPDVVFEPSTGLGNVYSYTVVHHPANDSFKADTPFVLALVDFDEGFRAMLNVVGDGSQEIRISARVCVVFEQRTPDQKIPQARLQLA